MKRELGSQHKRKIIMTILKKHTGITVKIPWQGIVFCPIFQVYSKTGRESMPKFLILKCLWKGEQKLGMRPENS